MSSPSQPPKSQARGALHRRLAAALKDFYFTWFVIIYIIYYLNCNTWLLLFISVYFTAYASCLLSVLFSVCSLFLFFSFLFHCTFLWSTIFTTVLLIIGRQLELCVFPVTCHYMIYICNLMWKYGKINWWWHSKLGSDTCGPYIEIDRSDQGCLSLSWSLSLHVQSVSFSLSLESLLTPWKWP